MPEGGSVETPGTTELRARAARLSPEAVLLVLDGAPPDAPAPAPVESRVLRYTSTDPATGGQEERTLVLLTGPSRSMRSLEELRLDGSGNGAVAAGELGRQLGDVKTLARVELAPLDARTRAEVLEFLAAATAGDAHGARTSEALHALREALRERLPRHVNRPGRPRGLQITSVLAVDERSFYIEGWMWDDEAPIVRLTAVSPEGQRVELLDRLFRYRRPDVATLFDDVDAKAELGFLCFFELPGPSRLPAGWIVELENADGTAVEVPAPRVTQELAVVREAILHDPLRPRTPSDELMLSHASPALMLLQARVADSARIDEVQQFGERPAKPVASIVVPLYGRLDHIEMQLAEFADDPEMQESDLVYVLDSTEQAEAFLETIDQLWPIYPVPLRAAILERNVGFTGAVNAGASLAAAPHLVVMHTDVVPDKPGWLSSMRAFYESTGSCGVLGPKLMYEDDSIQHAGFSFVRRGGSAPERRNAFRGLHRMFPAANEVRTVPAVSSACLMVDRGLYEEHGGLRGIYVGGEYEDVDLCMRLAEAGRETWYLPDVELYHLEGQSHSAGLREAADRYNAWLCGHLWRERIEVLAERPSVDGALATATRSTP